ncbi:hypothetical protein BDZ89DRAFT_955823 [Hymenopellis radicata]|nr:hypothetical protein BDZ89DRAFT_955823 [Hymenopellis radicata]
MIRVGPKHFGGSVCDSTGNTLSSRHTLRARHPILIIFPDGCHHVSSLIKDICKLPYFSRVITVIRSTITFFHQSHHGISSFAVARKDLKTGRALESIGKTRFATMTYSARSIQRNIPAFRRIFTRENLTFEHQDLFDDIALNLETSAANIDAMQFQMMLGKLVSIGMPSARVLACMELNYTTAGDFYLLWHAMVNAILDVIQAPTSRWPQDVQDAVRDIIAHRHSQIFSVGGNLYTPEYLVAAYLNPGMYFDLCRVSES